MIHKISQMHLPLRVREVVVLVVCIVVFGSVAAQQIPAYSDFSAGLTSAQRETLDAVVNDVQTTVFVNNGVMQVSGSGNARVLDFSISQLSSVNWASPMLSEVELIRVRLDSTSDLQSTFNISSANSLTHLSYVLLLSSVEATSSQLSNVVTGSSSNVQSFYEISIPN